MRWPQIQFGTSTLLLIVACSAIVLGGSVASWRAMVTKDPQQEVREVALVVVAVSPWWIPFAFAAYCIGQGRLTAKATAGFAVAEVAAFGGLLWFLYG